MTGKKVVLTVLIVLFVVLVLLNRKPVEVHLIVSTLRIAGAILYPLLLILGAVAGWFGCTLYHRNKTKKEE